MFIALDTRPIPSEIVAIETSALLVNATPRSTVSFVSLTTALISDAASVQRCAKLRTSEATTANPCPAWPARAASTPALSAKRFVWNAIESMTSTIDIIFENDISTSAMADFVSITTFRLIAASCSTPRAATSALVAPAAETETLLASSRIAFAIFSRVAALVSVRRPKSPDAIARWAELSSIIPELSRSRIICSASWETAVLKS